MIKQKEFKETSIVCDNCVKEEIIQEKDIISINFNGKPIINLEKVNNNWLVWKETHFCSEKCLKEKFIKKSQEVIDEIKEKREINKVEGKKEFRLPIEKRKKEPLINEQYPKEVRLKNFLQAVKNFVDFYSSQSGDVWNNPSTYIHSLTYGNYVNEIYKWIYDIDENLPAMSKKRDEEYDKKQQELKEFFDKIPEKIKEQLGDLLKGKDKRYLFWEFLNEKV